jgi:hypothetical protein
MSDKLLNIFNTQLSEFILELIKIFPQDKDFRAFKNGFNLLKLADEKKPLELFYKGMVDNGFDEKIKTKNEDFFLNNNYNKIISDVDDDNINDKLINKLKNYWNDLTADNKNTVWTYFGNLLKISEKYYIKS